MANDKTFPSDEADKYVVRFPAGMRDEIAKAAKAAGRSMNSEIIARLAASVSSTEDAALLRQDAETLREALATVKRVALISAVLPQLLGTTFRAVLEKIPADRRPPGADSAIALANAIHHADGDALARELAAMLLPAHEVEPAIDLIRADLRAAESLGLERRTPDQDFESLKSSVSRRLPEAEIIRREPKQPMLSQGPRARKR